MFKQLCVQPLLIFRNPVSEELWRVISLHWSDHEREGLSVLADANGHIVRIRSRHHHHVVMAA